MMAKEILSRLFGEGLPLNDTARSNAPGEFIKLPDGHVHYELCGLSGGSTVVLVHGFITPYGVWDSNFAALTAAGFQVLRYDLYGRGYSDRPKTRYDLDLFNRQLFHLLEELEISTPVDLVGFSMGGAIVTAYTDHRPDHVRKLILIDTAGFAPKITFPEQLRQAPLIGELISYRELRPEKFPPALWEQMRYKGFRHAILSTIRYGPLRNLDETYRRVGLHDREVLLLWGELDATIPIPTHRKVKEAIPQLEFHPIPGAGHAPHREKPDIVNPILIEFLLR
jgi:pimeloyl-ACP methyl ester carboxylesterase